MQFVYELLASVMPTVRHKSVKPPVLVYRPLGNSTSEEGGRDQDVSAAKPCDIQELHKVGGRRLGEHTGELGSIIESRTSSNYLTAL